MVTKEQAMTGRYFYNPNYRHKDGSLKRFIAGKCKTWKTRPKLFRLPIRRGMFDKQERLWIHVENSHEWYADPNDVPPDRVAVTLGQIIAADPNYAAAMKGFADYWAATRQFPVIMINYLVDECAHDHPEWDLKPLLDRLQWIVGLHPRGIIMPFTEVGESAEPAPLFPAAIKGINETIDKWFFRISETERSHEYFSNGVGVSGAHVVPCDVVSPTTPPDYEATEIICPTPAEAIFKLLEKM